MIDLVSTEEAANRFGLSPNTIYGASRAKGWTNHGPEDGRALWRVSDIAAYAQERAGRMDDHAHDGFTRGGAEKLANKIRTFWAKRGHDVRVWVEEVAVPYTTTMRLASYFVVRSDLVNGKPGKGERRE